MTVAPGLSTPTIHATALIVGEAGILIRGRSGAGKSRLAEQLVEAARARGWFGQLVADDRVRIEARGGRLVLSPHPSIACLVERRGQGIFRVGYEAAVVLRLVVDLVDRDSGADQPPRHPEPEDLAVLLEGIRTPRHAAMIGDDNAPATILRLVATKGAQNVG